MTRIGIEAILFFMGTFLCGGGKYCDFTVNHPDGKSVGVEVKHFPILKGHIKLRLRDTIKRLKRIIDEGKYTKIRLVLVAGNANVLRRLNDYINELDAPNISFTIGLLSYSGGFEALRSTPYDEPLRFHTCFISFTEADDAFSERLYNDLQANGVRCWRWKEGAQWDKTLMHSIDEAVRVYDKLIVVCSEQSLNSPPVIREIERALQKEDDLARQGKEGEVLFPIRLDDFIFSGWEHPRKANVTAKTVGDFRRWKNYDDYQKAFDRLLSDLKAVA